MLISHFRKREFLVSLLTTLLIVLFYATIRSQTSDFVAINGNFQNYNVIRRLLEGQTPYLDFIPYLGSGPLYLTSLFTLLGGGTFGSSITICNILTILVYPMVIYQISYYYFNRNGIIPFSLLVLVIYLNNFDNLSLCGMIASENSLRGVRGMILPMCLFLCNAWMNIVERKFKQNPFKDGLTLLGLSIIAGFSFCWSNDYGVCVWLSLCLMVCLITLIRSRSVKKTFGACVVMGVGSVLSIIITATILSKGNFFAWLKGNFDFSDYMKWYYNIPTNKVYYIFDLDITLSTILAFCLLVFFIIQIVRNNASSQTIKRYGYSFFCLIASLGTAQEYHLFSGGGHPLHEMLDLITYTLIMFELLSLCICYFKRYSILSCNFFKRHHYIYHTSIYIILLFIGICALFLEFSKNYTSNAIYVSELGGKFSSRYRDIIQTKNFLQQHPGLIFSTYASAAEVLSNQFQPSGIDYIIHVLSDEARSAYINTLEEINPKYITTIREDYIAGIWIRNANWFFYRKIYKDYHIIFRNSYQYFWNKNSQDDENIFISDTNPSVNVEVINHHQTRITINAPNIETGIADVQIDYSIKILSSISSRFLINSVVGVYSNHSEEILNLYLYKHERNHFLFKNSHLSIQRIDAWSLRPNSSEYIPIDIIDGKGTVLLESYPNDNTELHVHSAKCERIIVKPE